MSSKAWNLTKKTTVVFLILIGLVLLLIGGSVLYIYLNKEEVKNRVVTELNQSLKSEISVDKMDLVFIRTFPFVSVEFRNVLGKEVLPEKEKRDTLFHAGKVYMKFSLLDFYKGQYFIKQVRIEKGSFRMKIFKDGSTNYEFWENSDKPSSLFLKLEKINISDVLFRFQNYANKQYYDIVIKKSLSTGDFNAGWNQIRTKNSLFINLIQSNQTLLAQHLPAELDVLFVHEGGQDRISISENKLLINSLPFSIQGSYVYKKGAEEIDARILSNQIQLEKLISVLPEPYQKKLAQFTAKGLLDIELTLKGKMDVFHVPSINAVFSIVDASLQNKAEPIQIKCISLSGSFSNGKKQSPESSVFLLDQFSAQINEGFIKGKASLSNLENPFIKGDFEIHVELNDLSKIHPFKEIQKISGVCKAGFSFSGKLNDFTQSKAYINEQCKIKGQVSISKGYIQLSDFQKPFENFNMELDFTNNQLDIKKLQTKIANSTLQYNGHLLNVPAYLLEKKQLVISGKAQIDQLLTRDFLSKHNSDSSSSLALPERMAADLSLSIGHLHHEQVKAQNIACRILISDHLLTLDKLQMKAFEGDVSGRFMLAVKPGNIFDVQGNAAFVKVNIGSVFTSFNNFGQDLFTPENVKGKLSTSLSFSMKYIPQTGIDIKSLKTIADITLEDGELINISPLQKLSLFLEEESLKNIKFKTLKNTLQIQNNRLEIPEMEVSSNAVNFSLHGSHTFDNEIDYHLRLLLSELSSKKQKKRLQKEQDEFGVFEEAEGGKINLFINIKGTTDHPVFKYDFPSARKQLKENIQKEKTFLKEALKKEFNTQEELIQKENWKTQEKGHYIMDWETDTISKEKPKAPKKESKFTIQWDE